MLVVEDGPTLTHGEMKLGAGMVAALKFGGEPVDPRPYLVGKLQETFAHYDDIGFVDILRDIATSEGVPSDFANLHPTWYQQKKIADMAYPTLARVMGESTGPAINPFQLLIQIRLALGEDTEELQLL